MRKWCGHECPDQIKLSTSRMLDRLKDLFKHKHKWFKHITNRYPAISGGYICKYEWICSECGALKESD